MAEAVLDPHEAEVEGEVQGDSEGGDERKEELGGQEGTFWGTVLFLL